MSNPASDSSKESPNLLEKDQTLPESTSPSWEIQIIRQAASVNAMLNRMQEVLRTSELHSLWKRVEDTSGRSEFLVNVWLRTFLIMFKALSRNDNPGEGEFGQPQHSFEVERVFLLMEQLLLVQKGIKNGFRNMESNLRKMQQAYKPYINPIRTVGSITEIKSGHSQAKAKNPSDPNPALVLEVPFLCYQCKLTLIKMEIEFTSQQDSELPSVLKFPTNHPQDNLSLIKAFTAYVSSVVSKSQLSLNPTVLQIEELLAELKNSVGSLLSLLKEQKRIRKTVYSIELKKRLQSIESNFVEVTDIISNIFCNLTRVIGTMDYLGRTCLKIQPEVMLKIFLKNCYHGRMFFGRKTRVKTYRSEALGEAEEFFIRCMTALNASNVSIWIPETPEMAAIIMKHSSVQTEASRSNPVVYYKFKADLRLRTEYFKPRPNSENADVAPASRPQSQLDNILFGVRSRGQSILEEIINTRVGVEMDMDMDMEDHDQNFARTDPSVAHSNHNFRSFQNDTND